MTDLWLTLLENMNIAFSEVHMMTAWEALAVLLAMAYLLLAMKASVWCWAAAFTSTAIYTVLFWKVSLLMESILNVYYMAMALYGYWLWTQGGDKQQGVKVTTWPLKKHLTLIVTTGIISLLVGHGMATYTQAAFPYLDAATTCFAVMTTYLVAQKVLENWLYWVVIDLVSIYLYLSKGLMLTSLLFVLYVGMAVVGYFLWRAALANDNRQDNTLSLIR
ncbi:nicotinamide riboside transporter PnuC [Shewanella putrefaciens]|uniref:Nicotinamide riboside transporter PnuC n=2 Tax=Shewanella putrefaciens TaxID=24 RepID=A0ABX8XGI3_SHEPU|nr:nicotinamide riboside transporter PnuC [Shewanella putrefaciens]AVV82679.1 nicotinamide mononucleotide transporter [Shewanella putrefaciens]MCT8942026.1 nicotinamide riboside transporter PnuC [Shewanella putrefaciens]QSE50917.1 nicotinamide mononucleotide transporter [Shewanella putrefaciens]QYX74328.1 nicotinamide riboside transporter PnuC [Shewanella putrefaciens]SUI58212.1 Nicotinamide riboside transporter pnuC [Shewanella putrefaciens]